MTTVGDPLRAAVIGCGAIAHEHLAFLARSPDATLVGLCDRSAALAQAARDLYTPAPVYYAPPVVYPAPRVVYRAPYVVRRPAVVYYGY